MKYFTFDYCVIAHNLETLEVLLTKKQQKKCPKVESFTVIW